MKYAKVTTTFSDASEASSLIEGALKARLAACVERAEVVSDYWWQGKLEQANEISVTFKTRGPLVDALKAYILNNHSYKTPQVLVQEIAGGNEAYLRWVDAETAGGRLS
jgi:periplasmic divalent cation tolerance protein